MSEEQIVDTGNALYGWACDELDKYRALDPDVQLTRREEILSAFRVFVRHQPSLDDFSNHMSRLVLTPEMLWMLTIGNSESSQISGSENMARSVAANFNSCFDQRTPKWPR